MAKLFKIVLLSILTFYTTSNVFADSTNFKNWVTEFKTRAIKEGISESTVNISLQNVKFLPKVIEYDRFQPEFYEDTKTYIGKRTNKKKVQNGLSLYNKQKNNNKFYR